MVTSIEHYHVIWLNVALSKTIEKGFDIRENSHLFLKS